MNENTYVILNKTHSSNQVSTTAYNSPGVPGTHIINPEKMKKAESTKWIGTCDQCIGD